MTPPTNLLLSLVGVMLLSLVGVLGIAGLGLAAPAALPGAPSQAAPRSPTPRPPKPYCDKAYSGWRWLPPNMRECKDDRVDETVDEVPSQAGMRNGRLSF